MGQTFGAIESTPKIWDIAAAWLLLEAIKGKLVSCKSCFAVKCIGFISNHSIEQFSSSSNSHAAAMSHILGVDSIAPKVCPNATLVKFKLDTPRSLIFPGNIELGFFCKILIDLLHKETHSLC